ncbi:MAG: ammonium transporter [Cryomorphaceae bacterium]|nr:MAG: ammonium transporter [Cryomorphaceae bacterium]
MLYFFGQELILDDFRKESAADVAWLITATCLVFLMTPGLSFFYGGMVSKKNILSTMLQSFMALGLISLIWVFVGFSLSFGDSFFGLIGNPFQHFLFNNITLSHSKLSLEIPLLLFALFQMKFAIIAPAITTGSFTERINFNGFLLFMSLFCLLIYCPLAHWTWHPDGFLNKWGVLDFAGGAVVHISAGFASLAGAIYLGKRKFKHLKSYNTSYVLLGTGMLWFGWFGFNSGSALGANEDAILAFVTTNTASAICMISWLVIEGIKGHKIKVIDACIGAVVGLVIITPAAGFVNISQSMFMGAIGAVICNLFLDFFKRFDIDDSLDVFACHGMGGIVGLLLTGIFAKDVGLFYGEITTFKNHIYALIIISIFTFFGSLLIYKITALMIPIRVSNEIEEKGLDHSIHGETLN